MNRLDKGMDEVISRDNSIQIHILYKCLSLRYNNNLLDMGPQHQIRQDNNNQEDILLVNQLLVNSSNP